MKKEKVLAISSGGGHWVQLRRVLPAFDDATVVFATVNPAYRQDQPDDRVHVIEDATRWDRWKLIKMSLQILWILIRERPHVVFTTGAAPGCLAIVLGHFLGAKTIWLDSIANVEEVSMSGRLVRKYADLWLTQWPHLAGEEDGPQYAGAVI